MFASRQSCLAGGALVVLLGGVGTSLAQPRTMGSVLNGPAAFDGYTLFECLRYPQTYLVDNRGRLVHSWQSQYDPGAMAYILENGHLLRGSNPGGNDVFNAGGAAGLVEEFAWEGNLVWQFLYSNDQVRHHHDIAHLPSGNVLMIAWEYKSGEEAIAAGRDPNLLDTGELWPDHLVEVEPVGADNGNIVWEWHAWDHLIQDFDSTKANYGVVADHPELADLNYPPDNGNADWMHVNAINYNAELDQIVISVPRFNEFWILDHSTTTEEASGHTGGVRGMGGDILYRWGNPESYDRGTAADNKLYFQHDTHWIPEGRPGAGNILVFNNGANRSDGNYSSVEEIVTAVDANGNYPFPPPGVPHGPDEALWVYTGTPPESLFSSFISGAERLPNGNTLICEGANGTIQEVEAVTEEIVWIYVNPVNTDGPMIQGTIPNGNLTFRSNRYAVDFAGFEGKVLLPGAPVERYVPTAVDERISPRPFALRQNHPNPFGPSTTIGFSLADPAEVNLDVYNVAGQRVTTLVSGHLGVGEHRYTWTADRLPSGVYHYALRVGAETATRRMVLVR